MYNEVCPPLNLPEQGRGGDFHNKGRERGFGGPRCGSYRYGGNLVTTGYSDFFSQPAIVTMIWALPRASKSIVLKINFLLQFSQLRNPKYPCCVCVSLRFSTVTFHGNLSETHSAEFKTEAVFIMICL